MTNQRSKAIIYARFSPRPDAETSKALEAQLAACREYCAKNKYQVAGEYSDANMSGHTVDRPGLWEAVDNVKRGYVLVVRDWSRIARDVLLCEHVNKKIDEAGGRIEAIVGANGDTPEQKLLRQIRNAIHEYERLAINARTKAAMKRHQRNGRRMSAICPFGWTKDPEDETRMIPDPGEQEKIRQVIQTYHETGSYRGTAQALVEKGITGRDGKAWHHNTIKAIIARAKNTEDTLDKGDSTG